MGMYENLTGEFAAYTLWPLVGQIQSMMQSKKAMKEQSATTEDLMGRMEAFREQGFEFLEEGYDQSRSDAESAWGKSLGAAEQMIIDQGLSGQGVMPSVRLGATRQLSDVMGRIDEREMGANLGWHEQSGVAEMDLIERRSNQRAGLILGQPNFGETATAATLGHMEYNISKDMLRETEKANDWAIGLGIANLATGGYSAMFKPK